MIAKITAGASFGGALNYLMTAKEKLDPDGEKREAKMGEKAPGYRKGERHRILGGNVSGQTRGEIAKEFEAIRRRRPDIAKPVHHVSISAGESDRITPDQWREIASDYIEKMGFKNSPFVVVQHRDGKVDHIHILTSRVGIDRRVVRDWQSKRRAEKLMRETEKKYGLEQIKSSHEIARAAPKRGEIETFNRTGELSAKMALQGHIERALRSRPTIDKFLEQMTRAEVEVIPKVQPTGRVTGISFRYRKELLKGSDLGRGFSWNGLQERGLSYKPDRDRGAFERATDRARRAQISEQRNGQEAARAIDCSPTPQYAPSMPSSVGRAPDYRAGGRDTDRLVDQLVSTAKGPSRLEDRLDSRDRLNQAAGVDLVADKDRAFEPPDRAAELMQTEHPGPSIAEPTIASPEIETALEDSLAMEIDDGLELGLDLLL